MPKHQKTKVRKSFTCKRFSIKIFYAIKSFTSKQTEPKSSTCFGKENELKGKCENSTKKGSKSYIQALYIRADDLTNLVPATKFAHLDVTTVLLKGLVAKRYLQQ